MIWINTDEKCKDWGNEAEISYKNVLKSLGGKAGKNIVFLLQQGETM